MTTCLYFQDLAYITGHRRAWRFANSIDIPGKWQMPMELYNFKVNSWWGWERSTT
jgi:hypothetical protein